MDALLGIKQSIGSKIASMEGKFRKRSADAQRHFEYAIATILKDLWRAAAISPNYECDINKRTAY